MRLVGILGVVFGVAILLIAIPFIDDARSSVEVSTTAPIAYIFGTLLLLTVLGIVSALVAAVHRS